MQTSDYEPVAQKSRAGLLLQSWGVSSWQSKPGEAREIVRLFRWPYWMLGDMLKKRSVVRNNLENLEGLTPAISSFHLTLTLACITPVMHDHQSQQNLIKTSTSLAFE